MEIIHKTTMSQLTMLVPKGAYNWAINALRDDNEARATTTAIDTLVRASRLVQRHRGTIADTSVLFHVGATEDGAPLERVVPLLAEEYTSSFNAMDSRFYLLDLIM